MSENQPNEDAAEIPGNFVKGVPEGPVGEEGGVEGEAAGEDTADLREQQALKEQLQAMTDERDDAQDKLLRLQAEMENYRKRVQRERDEERRFAAMPLIRDLLPGLDNLQRALDAARHTDDHDAMLQGVEMVAAQIDEIFTRHGASPIPAVGEPFDPNRHEAIQQMPSADHPPMTVIDEVERGYTLNDRVVRPSKVIVSVKPPEE